MNLSPKKNQLVSKIPSYVFWCFFGGKNFGAKIFSRQKWEYLGLDFIFSTRKGNAGPKKGQNWFKLNY